MNIKVKQLTSVLLSMMLLCLFNACSEEQEMEIATGGLQISLAEDWVDVTSSRATPAQLHKPLQEQFHLKVTKQDTKNVVHDGAFRSYFRTLTPGEYTLEATYGENKVLDWDAPYYAGSVTANVENGSSTQATIPVSVKNALMSVEFTNPEIFGQIYSQYGLEVKVPTSGGSQSLTIWSDITEKSAYLRAGLENVEVAFVGTTIEGNKKIKYSLTENLVEAETLPLQAADHAKITLTAANTGINVTKIEVANVTVEETVPMEWLPIPKVTGFANGATSLDYVETNDAIDAAINFTASMPIQDVEFTFDFEDPQYTHLNKKHLLSTLSDEEYKALTNAGVTLPIIGAKTGYFDLSNMTANLQTDEGVSTTNRVNIRVKANNRWSSEEGQEYTINVTKPEFAISVSDFNIWTKEVTVNALTSEDVSKGDLIKLNSKIIYQYKTASGKWANFNNGLRQNDLKPGTLYSIKGVYRNGIESKAITVTTYPTPILENGDMEDWTEEERGYYFAAFGINKQKLHTYYPWNSTQYWNTNNDFTTRYRDASSASFSTVYKYNSFPAVSYTKDVNSGTWAAELRNTAAGRGNTSDSKSSYDFNNVPGELFIGTINVTEEGIDAIPNDSYTINPGASYVSRPTAINFFYKYAPYTTDSWKVYIALYNANGDIIAENSMTDGNTTNSYTNIELPFIYKEDRKISHIPAKLYIYFASSISSGASLPYHSMDVTTYYGDNPRTITTLSGSVFKVDDIELIYDK